MVSKNRNLLLIISALAIVGFLTIFLFNFITPPQDERPRPGYSIIPMYRLFLDPLLLVVAVVSLSYYFMVRKIEAQTKTILRLIEKSNLKPKALKRANRKDTILKILNLNERNVLNTLIEKKGSILQSEITRMEGMTKLKTHRAVKNLEQRGIISTEKYGKTKRLILTDDIKKMML